jgi:DNA uptake protein ComE-like DNA-binding protein
MKKIMAAGLTGIAVGAIALLWIRRLREQSTPSIHVTTADLDYQDRSQEELGSADLVDLNNARREELEDLNLNPDSLERIIENRPYRSKLELISRMIVSEAEYETLRDKVGVAEGRESVKIA